LRLASTLEITETKSGRATHALHTFYELDDGSYLAFFEVPETPFQFKPQHDYDLHVALDVERGVLENKLAEGKARGIESRGISDHGFIHSIYFRDPNGYVIELTAKMPNHAQAMNPATNGARAKLDKWQAAKRQHATA
jgi:catechol-2,3-dioxygenase